MFDEKIIQIKNSRRAGSFLLLGNSFYAFGANFSLFSVNFF